MQKFCIRTIRTVDGPSILSQPVSYTGYLLGRSTKKAFSLVVLLLSLWTVDLGVRLYLGEGDEFFHGRWWRRKTPPWEFLIRVTVR